MREPLLVLLLPRGIQDEVTRGPNRRHVRATEEPSMLHVNGERRGATRDGYVKDAVNGVVRELERSFFSPSRKRVRASMLRSRTWKIFQKQERNGRTSSGVRLPRSNPRDLRSGNHSRSRECAKGALGKQPPLSCIFAITARYCNGAEMAPASAGLKVLGQPPLGIGEL